MNVSGSQLKLLDADLEQSRALVPLRIAGDINYENAHRVVELVKKHLGEGAECMTLDMREVEMIDSSGLKSLLQAKRLCEEADVCFKLTSVSDSVTRIIAMSGFGPMFGIISEDISVERLGRQLPADETGWKTYERQAISDPYVISVLRRVVLNAAEEAGASRDIVCDVQIAVGEALTNAYRHGSPVKGESKIYLKCMACPQALVVEIRDEGAPFDPDSVSIPDPNLLRDHGMGIYLMRQAMDVVEFQSNCPGNKVRMIKWFDTQ